MYVDRNVKTFNDDVEEFTHIINQSNKYICQNIVLKEKKNFVMIY